MGKTAIISTCLPVLPISSTREKLPGYRVFRGGQGVPPLGCLPLWGREGVTLTIITENTNLESSEKLTISALKNDYEIYRHPLWILPGIDPVPSPLIKDHGPATAEGHQIVIEVRKKERLLWYDYAFLSLFLGRRFW